MQDICSSEAETTSAFPLKFGFCIGSPRPHPGVDNRESKRPIQKDVSIQGHFCPMSIKHILNNGNWLLYKKNEEIWDKTKQFVFQVSKKKLYVTI